MADNGMARMSQWSGPWGTARIVWLTCLLLAAACARSSSAQPESLGGAPLCEASAAAVVACPGSPAPCLLVGDNEVRDRLFRFGLHERRVDVPTRSAVGIRALLEATGDAELSDIEAFATLGDGSVIVYGSHSRNSDCKRRKKRRRILEVRFVDGTPVPGRVPLRETPKRADLASLLGPAPRGLLATVAARIQSGEESADRGACDEAFNLEAAFATKPGDEVWVGLRRPLVEGHAVLLRQDIRSSETRMTDARLVDLGGEGFRGAAYAGDTVYALSAGGGSDESAPFVLWQFPAALLGKSERIEAERVGDVPASSEGVAVHDGRVIVLTDGAEGNGVCRRDSTWTVLDP